MPNQRLTQTPSRETEGRHHTKKHEYKVNETRGQRKVGRPLGSKSQPKTLLPKDKAAEILGIMKDILPPEHYADIRDAIRKGKNISTLSEAKILMKLMGPPVWMRLVQETIPKEEEVPQLDPDLIQEIGASPKPKVQPFDKDLTERVKVLMGLIQLVDRMEKDDEGQSDTAQPIIEIFAGRGFVGARLKELTSQQQRSVGGDVDGVRGEAPEIRAIPDSIPERPFDVQDSEQESSVGLQYDDISGNDSRGGYAE